MSCFEKGYIPDDDYYLICYYLRLSDFELECLCELENLLEHKDLEKITVKDMISNLNCSKNKFYARYSNVRDMIEKLYSKFSGFAEKGLVIQNGMVQNLSLEVIKIKLLLTEYFPLFRKVVIQVLAQNQGFHECILNKATAGGMTNAQIDRLIFFYGGCKAAIDAWQYSKKLSRTGIDESSRHLKTITDTLVDWVNSPAKKMI